MPRYEAIFDIDSKADARAVRLLMDQVYNVLREELREVYHGQPSPKDTLEEFRALRDSSQDLSPGRLTVVYEKTDEPFDD